MAIYKNPLKFSQYFEKSANNEVKVVEFEFLIFFLFFVRECNFMGLPITNICTKHPKIQKLSQDSRMVSISADFQQDGTICIFAPMQNIFLI